MLAKLIQTAISAFYLLSKVKETIANIPEVTVETLVILDKELSDKIEYDYARKHKYCEIFEEVQTIYGTLREDGMNITINLSKLKLVKKKEDQPNIGTPKITESDSAEMDLNETDFSTLQEFFQNKPWSENYDTICFLTN